MYSLEELFCPIDDFCLKFEPAWRKQLIASGKRCRDRQLKLSEVMTILVAFHQSPCKNFKGFYLGIVSNYWRQAFPRLVTYHRFVEWRSLYNNSLNDILSYLFRYKYRNWIY